MLLAVTLILNLAALAQVKTGDYVFYITNSGETEREVSFTVAIK